MSGSVPYARKTVQSASAVTIASAGTTVMLTPGQPVDVVRAGVIVTTATTVAVTKLTVQKRPVAAAAADQVTLAEFNVPVLAAGKVSYFDLPELGAVNPGEDLAIVSDGGATAGAGFLFVEVLERPFVGDRIANATAAADAS